MGTLQQIENNEMMRFNAVSQSSVEDDPFKEFTTEEIQEFSQPGLKSSARAAVKQGFHVFPLMPRDKVTLPGSHGFKDSKDPSNPLVLNPWDQDPNRNIGIDLGASDLCVLDFDQPESIPTWLNETKTLKVMTAKGVHIYFRGARKTTKLHVDDNLVGDIKSQGGYVLAAGSVHPSGAIYTVIDDSPIADVPARVSELVKHDAERVEVTTDGPIIEGSRNSMLTSILGRARQVLGMDKEQLLTYGLSVNEKRCQPPLKESEVRAIANSIGRYEVKPSGPETVLLGGVPVGQTATAVRQQNPEDWGTGFKAVDELEQGEVRMLIDGFLPEGMTFLGGLPGEGKTLFALSIARALTTGRPFLNTFGVPQIVPVIYMIPESGGRAFRKRCETFEIPKDRDKFLCRTISEGATLPLDDVSLLEAVRQLRPVVILDTVIRFSESEDENAAAQNKKLVDDVVRLRQAGAVAVIGLHHATKAMRKDGMSLETALRGTGDIAASADAVYGLLRDSVLYNNGEGPNEIDVKCLKPRDFDPPQPFRIAATVRPVGSRGGLVVGMESVIDDNHDFAMVSRGAQAQEISHRLEQVVNETPTITIKGLIEKVGRSEWEVRKTLERLGYRRARGGKKGATQWTKPDFSTVQVRSEMGNDRFEAEQEADISFDIPAA